jgi:hypothetical protein
MTKRRKPTPAMGVEGRTGGGRGRACCYCGLCRAKEIELYGTVLNTTDQRHVEACEAAGCEHPPFYVVDFEAEYGQGGIQSRGGPI